MQDLVNQLNEDPSEKTMEAIAMLQVRAAMEITRLQRQVSKLTLALDDQSWRVNPDRMGGQFTQEEIDRATRGGEGW